MFCPHCGKESTTDLNYCVRCGGSLNPLASSSEDDAPPAAIRPATAWAVGTTMLLLVVVGLALLLVMVDELSHRTIPPEVLVLTMLFGAFALLGGVALTAWLWSRLLGSPRSSAKKRKLRRPAANTGELAAADMDALPPARAFSVTEHTTRTLERGRKN